MISANKMVDENTISGLIFFDPLDKIYKDHFPGSPVVPGSIIINAFVELLKNNVVINKKISIRNFRFKSFIEPGEYKYDICCGESSFKCRLFKNEKVAVTGEVVI